MWLCMHVHIMARAPDAFSAQALEHSATNARILTLARVAPVFVRSRALSDHFGKSFRSTRFELDVGCPGATSQRTSRKPPKRFPTNLPRRYAPMQGGSFDVGDRRNLSLDFAGRTRSLCDPPRLNSLGACFNCPHARSIRIGGQWSAHARVVTACLRGHGMTCRTTSKRWPTRALCVKAGRGAGQIQKSSAQPMRPISVRVHGLPSR